MCKEKKLFFSRKKSLKIKKYFKNKNMKTIFPKVLYNSYKGQNGRMCIIGGSLNYTSSPFYSAISQLKGGADLAHIICTKQAAIPIKSYSPEIIVHPYINALNE